MDNVFISGAEKHFMQTVQKHSNLSLSTLLLMVFVILACVVAFFLTAKQSASKEETTVPQTMPQHSAVR
jgi:flagellar basal body-associated protein FliL